MKQECLGVLVDGKFIPRTLIQDENIHSPAPEGHVRIYEGLFAKLDNLTYAFALCAARNSRFAGSILWDVKAESEMADITQHRNQRPHWVIKKLSTSLHGCRYLLNEWEYLAKLARPNLYVPEFAQEREILEAHSTGSPFQDGKRSQPYSPPGDLSERLDRRRRALTYIDSKIAKLREQIAVHEIEERDMREMITLFPEVYPDADLILIDRELSVVKRDIARMWKNAQLTYALKPISYVPKSEGKPKRNKSMGKVRTAKPSS